MNVQEQIMESVKKSLPTMQVEALKGELEKANQHEALVNDNKRRAAEKVDLQKEIDSLRKLVMDLEKQIVRKEDLDLQERNLENKLLTNKAENLEARNSDLKELMHAAFRNPRFTTSETVTEDRTAPDYSHTTSTVNKTKDVSQD